MSLFDKIIKNKNNIFFSIRKTFDEHSVIKFISIIVLLLVYFLFASRTHGIKDGLTISILTWSFFVLCTPVASAGILVDFPMRLITGIKMMYSEITVWIVAIFLNIFMVFNNSNAYSKTSLLSLFKHIIDTPYPYWIIMILSGFGTFLSIYIADNLIDFKKKKPSNFLIKYRVAIFIFLIVLIVVYYNILLNKLGVNFSLV